MIQCNGTYLTVSYVYVTGNLFLCFFFRLSRGERSGRYGSDGRRDDIDWHERRSRDVERDYDRRWGDDRHRERFDERRDSPEVSEHLCYFHTCSRRMQNTLFLNSIITFLCLSATEGPKTTQQ